MAKKIKLNSALAEKFEVNGKPVSSKFVDFKYGLIDFKNMTVKQASGLVDRGFPYLVAKGAAKKLPPPDPKEGDKGK